MFEWGKKKNRASIDEFNTIDLLFLLSPSFYTILSGALIGAAINLLTGLIFSKEYLTIHLIFTTLFLLGSSGSWAYIGLILEDLRRQSGEDINTLKRKVVHRRINLYFSSFLGIIFLLVSLYFLISIFASSTC